MFVFKGSSNIGFKKQKLQGRYWKYVQNTDKAVLKEVKEGMMTMFHQMENNNKEMEIKGTNWKF